jgi:hypothetical protein
LRALIGNKVSISARSLRFFEPRLRIRGAVLRPLCGVGCDALLGTRDTALLVAHGALQAVTQHVKAAAVSAVARGIGHGGLSMWMEGQYARSGS